MKRQEIKDLIELLKTDGINSKAKVVAILENKLKENEDKHQFVPLNLDALLEEDYRRALDWLYSTSVLMVHPKKDCFNILQRLIDDTFV